MDEIKCLSCQGYADKAMSYACGKDYACGYACSKTCLKVHENVAHPDDEHHPKCAELVGGRNGGHCDCEDGRLLDAPESIVCPLCGALAPHEVIKGADGHETHAWICSETCPFVGFEAVSQRDTELVGLRLIGVREYACNEPECEAVSQTRSPAPPDGVAEYCDDHLDERKGA